ncbi:MAG TPA: DsbA family protein [Vicinamibacterales bacterium]|jgi:protein-disulfide isomerase
MSFRLLSVVVLCSSLVVGACGRNSSPSAPSSTSGPTTPLPSLESMLADKVLGQSQAPVTIIEYSSLSCPHCGDFHVNTLPLLKTGYLDTGKVKLIYRDYPLDGVALSASMIARCSGDRYFGALERLYQSQSTWSHSNDWVGALKQTVAPIGMTSADVDACLAYRELQNGILGMSDVGTNEFGVRATPTLIINGQKYEGAPAWSDLEAILRNLGA